MSQQNENKKKIILTGDRPTGRLHLGHYIGSLANRVVLQQECQQNILIADMQALTDHAEDPELVQESVLQLGFDYLSVGIDPEISTILIQSMVPELSELTMYYLNLVTVGRLEKNPTVKDEMKQKGFGRQVPAGFLMYPVSQAADITAFRANLVPVGADQLPVLEQVNEIVRTFNRIYKTDVLVESEGLVSAVSRLPGIDGKNKMGKSLGNCIFLSDPSDEVKRKVFEAYTDPGHIKVDDPGKVEGNMVFAYLDAFASDKNKVRELKERYRLGGLGDVAVKNYLVEVLEDFLTPIRKRRKELEKDPAQMMAILKRGTERARQVAAQTLKDAKEAMGIIY